MLEKQKREISGYTQALYEETFIDDCCMDFFYAQSQAYKSRIAIMQHKLDKETEIMETKLILKRIEIDKVNDQIKALNEEIERFHRREEKMRERLAKEEMEAQLLRMVSRSAYLKKNPED